MFDTTALPMSRNFPCVGDEVLVSREVLVEVARMNLGAPPSWRYLAAGTRGRLLGWRDRLDEPDSRAVIEVAGSDRRLVVFVGARQVVSALRRD